MKQLIVLILLLLPQVASAQAPQEMAAVLTVVHGEVMLRRANTEEWLPLPAGASGPIGRGDEVRTDATGRGRGDGDPIVDRNGRKSGFCPACSPFGKAD